MKKYTLFILFSSLLFFILGCKSEGDPFNPKTLLGYGYFRCKINGEDFVAATDIPFTFGSNAGYGFISTTGTTIIPPAAYFDGYVIRAKRYMKNEFFDKWENFEIYIDKEVKEGFYLSEKQEARFVFNGKFQHPFFYSGIHDLPCKTDSAHTGWIEITEFKKDKIISGRFGFTGYAYEIWGQTDTVILQNTVNVTNGVFSISTEKFIND